MGGAGRNWYISPMAMPALPAIRAGAIFPPSSIPDAGPRSPGSRPPGPGSEGGLPQRPGLGPARAWGTATDPRRPESILSRRERDDRLAGLLGEKAAIEGRQAQQAGLKGAEVASELSQLRSRDSEVRAHEAAHMAAGGRYITGGASYTYERGPDGTEYAVGGEVGIDTSAVAGRPEETVQKMRTIRAAALAPSDPSAADLAVAAAAAEIEAAALAEIAQARAEEAAGRYGAEAIRGADRGAGRGAGTLGPARDRPRDSLDLVA